MADEKILQEEKLTDEQLEQVSGGYSSQTRRDRKFFTAIGVNDDDNTIDGIYSNFGVDARTHRNDDNEYIFQGAYSVAHHPRLAAMGYVLNKINYPGYNGQWWDLDYTKKFISEHIGSDVLD